MKELLSKFKEPSSWAGLGLALSIIAPHIGLTMEAIPQIIQILSVFCGAAAFFIPEKK